MNSCLHILFPDTQSILVLVALLGVNYFPFCVAGPCNDSEGLFIRPSGCLSSSFQAWVTHVSLVVGKGSYSGMNLHMLFLLAAGLSI